MLRLAKVRKAAEKDKLQTFTSLAHHITPTLLRESFLRLSRKAAPGSDGLTWHKYNEDLERNIVELFDRLRAGRYRPKPARRMYIDKEDGSQRPIDIQCLEDKIVQQATVTVLNEIYETEFLGFSYGFRPGRSQHDALDALVIGITMRKVNWILDLDIQKFFDTVDPEWLILMIQHRIKDKRIIDLIIRWIRVGYVDEQGKRHPQMRGIPQGAVISPLLANVYLHYVLDLWVNQWRSSKGDITIVRYADDAVLGFQHEREARDFLQALRDRLGLYGLAVHADKTRLLRFGRFATKQCNVNGIRKPQTFDFLGFTHFCTLKSTGKFMVGRRTVRKRMIKQIKAVKKELRRRMHAPVSDTFKWLKAVLQGHFNYYSVPGNIKQLEYFREAIVKRAVKCLRRRSQRSRITWQKFSVFIDRLLPRPRILHDYPEERFFVRYPR